MKKNLQDIDNLFKDALEEHLEAAPPNVWDAVNNDLDKKQALHFRQKYFRLKRTALVLLLFLFSGIAYMLYFLKPANNNTALTQKQSIATQKEPASAKDISAPATTNTREKEIVKDEIAASKESTNAASNVSVPAKTIQEHALSANKKLAADNSSVTKKFEDNPASSSSLISDNSVATTNKKKNENASVSVLPVTASNKTKDAFSVENSKANKENLDKANRHPLLKTGEAAMLTTNAGNIKSNTSSGKIKANSKSSREINEDEIANNNTLNMQLPAANTSRSVTPLAPYQYLSPLFLSPVDYSTPASSATIDASAFVSIVKVDSALKIPSVAKPSYKHSLSLMAFASPNHSFTRLQNDDLYAGPGRGKQFADRDEKQGTSYSAGVLINYGIAKKLILQSGLVFTSATTNISPKTIYARPDNNGHTRYEFNCASGYSYVSPKNSPQPTVGDSIQVAGSSSTITYIRVPVSLNYVMQKGRFLFKPAIGISVNFLTSGKSLTSFSGWPANPKETASISGLKTAYLDGSVGFGTEFMLNHKISIGIRPLLRMAISSINKNTPVKTYQNYLSLETGLKINL